MSENEAIAGRALSRRECIVQTAGAATGVIAIVALGLPRPATAAPPVWSTIPDQVWTVGVPVHLDLADYCIDPEGSPLTFALDRALPDGVTLNGSVVSGTPTGEFPPEPFVASADDDEPPDPVAPVAPVGLRVK